MAKRSDRGYRLRGYRVEGFGQPPATVATWATPRPHRSHTARHRRRWPRDSPPAEPPWPRPHAKPAGPTHQWPRPHEQMATLRRSGHMATMWPQFDRAVWPRPLARLAVAICPVGHAGQTGHVATASPSKASSKGQPRTHHSYDRERTMYVLDMGDHHPATGVGQCRRVRRRTSSSPCAIGVYGSISGAEPSRAAGERDFHDSRDGCSGPLLCAPMCNTEAAITGEQVPVLFERQRSRPWIAGCARIVAVAMAGTRCANMTRVVHRGPANSVEQLGRTGKGWVGVETVAASPAASAAQAPRLARLD